jgi:thioredoxin 1
MQTIENINQILEQKEAVMLYFSSPSCSVCHVLKPKLESAIKENFDLFEVVGIDISTSQELAAHFGVFTAPTVIIYLGGREFLRKSRNMSVDEVVREIARPYEIMTS